MTHAKNLHEIGGAPGARDRLLADMEGQIPHLRRYARALTRDPDQAEDLLQDCLERGIARLDTFRPETAMRRWLFVIMRNLFIDRRRLARRRPAQVPLGDWQWEARQPPAQVDHVRLREVGEAMESLRPRDRWIVKRIVLDGRCYADVAAELDIALGTVKSGLSRARRSLAEAA